MSRRHLLRLAAAAVAAVASIVTLGAQYPPPSTVDPLHRPYDQLLDIHVRDGLIYYRALRGSRGGFDRYVASLDVPTAEYDGWTRPRQIAFWINAYNAFVIESVLDAYPINGRSSQYPRQQPPPGAGRLREAGAPRRRPSPDARRDREDGAGRLRRSARLPRPRPRRARRRTAAQLRLQQRHAGSRSGQGGRGVRDPARMRVDRRVGAGADGDGGLQLAGGRLRQGVRPGARCRPIPAAARSSARSCTCWRRTSCPASGRRWRRTTSRSASRPSTGSSTT